MDPNFPFAELSAKGNAEAGAAGVHGAPGLGQSGTMPLNYGGYQQYAAPVRQLEYGGFWIRVGAYIIDYLVLLVPNLIINGISQFFIQVRSQPGRPPDPIQIVSLVMLSFIPLVVDWLYYALMESSTKQATLGKMACGLIVIDENGLRISFVRATGRYFSKILSGLSAESGSSWWA